jgi:predicted ester cyclase
MQADEARAAIEGIFNEIINERNSDAIQKYVSEDFIEHTPMGDIHGHEGFHQFLQAWTAGFPDMRNEVSDIVVDGDLAYWTVRFTGTQEGPFNGMPATGKHVDMMVLNKGRLENGKAAEHWAAMDTMQMLMQLGLVPQPEGAAS